MTCHIKISPKTNVEFRNKKEEEVVVYLWPGVISVGTIVSRVILSEFKKIYFKDEYEGETRNNREYCNGKNNLHCLNNTVLDVSVERLLSL